MITRTVSTEASSPSKKASSVQTALFACSLLKRIGYKLLTAAIHTTEAKIVSHL